jgi:hypothetical protein
MHLLGSISASVAIIAFPAASMSGSYFPTIHGRSVATFGRLATNEWVTLKPVFASRPAPLGQETPTASRP